MTVENQIPYQSYIANGTQTSFALSFFVEDKSNFVVKKEGQFVTVNDYVHDTATNSIHFNVAPNKDCLIEIERVTSADRSITYATYNNSFRPETLNYDIDRIWRKLQELGYVDSVLALRLAKEIQDRVNGDKDLELRLTQEISKRILGDQNLQKQINSNDFDISVLFKSLEQETIKRINGDNEVALSSRAYTDFMLRMNNTNPSIFDGVTDNIVITESGESQRQLNQKVVKNLQSIDELRTTKSNKHKELVTVSSYYSDNSTGGGTFYWDATSIEVDNSGTVFKVINITTGRWKRQYTKLTFEDFGVVGNDRSIDDAVGIQKAINYLQTKVNGSISVGREGVIYYFKSSVIMTGTEAYVTEQNKMTVDFTGSKIIPTASNITCLVVNRNHVHIKNLHIHGDSATSNVLGVLFGSLTPEIKGGTCFCKLENYTAEYLAVAFKAQPTRTTPVTNSAAGAYYNEIINPIFMSTIVGFQFAGNDLALNNQNTRYNIFNPRQVGGDYMFRLECCETLKVFGGSAEFVGNTTGNGSVIYVPKIYPNHMIENQGNEFFGLTAEACNRLYENYSYDLGMFGISPINSIKPSIMGTGARIITKAIGRFNVESDIAEYDPILSVSSRPHNKQLFMRITTNGDPQIWADSTINIPQHIEMFNSIMAAGTVRAKQEIYTPKLVSTGTDLVLMSNSGTNGGFVISNNPTQSMIWNSAEKDTVFGGSPSVRANSDGAVKLGTATQRWGDIYSTNSVIQTSDERYKEQFRSLAEVEKAVALEIKANICIYKFKDAIELKGTDARWHVGVKAQQIVQIMTAHGLDWKEYGFICHDSWEATEDHTITIEPETYDQEGNILTEAVTKTIKGIEAGDRYAVRYEELIMFILASI